MCIFRHSPLGRTLTSFLAVCPAWLVFLTHQLDFLHRIFLLVCNKTMHSQFLHKELSIACSTVSNEGRGILGWCVTVPLSCETLPSWAMCFSRVSCWDVVLNCYLHQLSESGCQISTLMNLSFCHYPDTIDAPALTFTTVEHLLLLRKKLATAFHRSCTVKVH